MFCLGESSIASNLSSGAPSDLLKDYWRSSLPLLLAADIPAFAAGFDSSITCYDEGDTTEVRGFLPVAEMLRLFYCLSKETPGDSSTLSRATT